MANLVLLNTTQMQNYISGLNLQQGTASYNTLNAALLLPQPTFVRAISALAQGLIQITDLASLAAMNDSLVNQLINARLFDSDPNALFYNYNSVWLPAAINLQALQTSAVGSPSVYLSARLYDFWGQLIFPNYDFTGTNPASYFTYTQAFGAYLAAANAPEGAGAVAGFVAYHNQFRANYPNLLQASDADCPVLQAVLSLLTSAYFLEAPGGGRTPNEVLDLIQGATYRSVAPPNFVQFMSTVAVPAMVNAYSSDGSRTGAPGAASVANALVWGPLPATGVQWYFDELRMGTVYLPAAYGNLVLSEDEIDTNAGYEQAIVGYLDAARYALLTVLSSVQLNFPVAANTGPASGTATGMLLAITNP